MNDDGSISIKYLDEFEGEISDENSKVEEKKE